MFENEVKLYLQLDFILIVVNDMFFRKRLVNVEGSLKVYVDIDDVFWRIKFEVVDEVELIGVLRSFGKSLYFFRNFLRFLQIVLLEEEVIGYKFVKQ